MREILIVLLKVLLEKTDYTIHSRQTEPGALGITQNFIIIINLVHNLFFEW